MNILLTADISIADVVGGGERVLREQSTRLVRRGHNVSLLTRRLQGHKSDRQVIEGVTEYRYGVDRKSAGRFFITTLRNARRAWRVIRHAQAPEVINCHQPFTAYSVLRDPCVRSERTVYTCHSLAHEEFISRNPAQPGFGNTCGRFINAVFRYYLEHFCLKRSGTVVVLSQFTKEKLIRIHGLPSQKIVIIPGGVDLERFHPAADKKAIRRRIGIPEKKIVFLTVRNLVPRMGIAALIDAFGRLAKRFSEVFLVIAGEGPLRTDLEQRVRHAGLSEAVRFMGFVHEDDLADTYRMADMFILPTVELEGFGMVTLEAMASGVPVLGTPVGGTVEILGKFDDRLLFRDTSSDAMAELMVRFCQRIADQPGYQEELANRCRAFVENHFSWDRNIQELERVLRG